MFSEGIATLTQRLDLSVAEPEQMQALTGSFAEHARTGRTKVGAVRAVRRLAAIREQKVLLCVVELGTVKQK